MDVPDWLCFFERRFPSANMALVLGERPLLFDSGFGCDIDETVQLLTADGTPPDQLALVVNSHYHSDHVGGNAYLQARYGLPIAAHILDAAAVNRRDREVGAADWLGQPIEPYVVNRALHDGDVLDTGSVVLHVLHMPGHTRGQIALYAPEEQVLLCGDAVHGDDVAWIAPFHEGAAALDRAIESLERLARLPVRWAFSGHGKTITDPAAAFVRALARYETWRNAPEKLAWHACKRILAYALMLTDGLVVQEVAPYLLQCRWFQDYAESVFHSAPDDFAPRPVDEMVRSGAARWQGKRLLPGTDYTPPPAEWPALAVRPRDWPLVTDPADEG